MYMQSTYASSEEPGYFPCTIYETRSFKLEVQTVK